MTAPIITQFREMPRFMRSTAGFVLVAFTMLILQPLAIAAQAEVPQTQAAVAVDDDQKFSNTLQQIEDKLQRIKEKIEKQQDHGNDRNDLKQLQLTLHQLDIVERQNFQKVEQNIKSHNLPAEILDRHQAMIDNYQAEYATLMADLDALSAADNDGDRKFHAENVLKHFKAKPNKRTAQPFDPNNLPFQVPDGKVRAPKETKEELQKLIQSQSEPVQVAALELTAGMLAQTAAQASITPQPADLAATEDVQITDEIKALAKKLNNEPVAIYNWVRNNIEYIPTYGSIQGSQLTLDNLKGNAFDTASLLIALYRAAGIPARYAYGTVQIPIDQVMNWVGGVTNPMAALELLGQGGIPNIGIAQAGVIKSVKLEHVWVEAYVDFIPSRGAKHKAGDSWVPLDAAFKQYDYKSYIDLRENAPFNTQAFIDVFNDGTTANPQEGWFTSSNIPSVETAYQQANKEITEWLDRILAEGKDWRRLQKVIYSGNPILTGSLPYKVVTQSATFSTFSESLRRSFRFDLFASDFDRASGNAVFSYRTSLPALGSKRLTLGFAPATDADWTLIKSYLPNLPEGQTFTLADLPSTLPGYLIRLTAVLLLEDQPIKRGGSFTMGQDIFSTTEISRLSSGFHTAQNSHLAGEFLAIGLDLQGYGQKQLGKASDRTTVNVLHQAAKAYFYRRDMSLEYLRLLGQAAAYPAPSFGFFGTSLTPRYRFGVASQVKLNGIQIDVDAGAQILVPLDNNPAAKIRLTEQLGMALSAREHEIPESHLANEQYPGKGISAVNALTMALAQGQRLYQVDANNLDTALGQAALSYEIETDVRNAVNAGQVALIHEKPLLVGSWSGAGYILTDTRTGAGAYRISGGLNGGAMETEVSEGLALAGLSVLSGDGVALVKFAIPAAHADEGICGNAQQERVNVSSLALGLIAGLLTALLNSYLPPIPGKKKAVAAMISVFTSAQAVAQARKNLCYVYYVGNTTPDGVDISELASHISSAIASKKSAYNGMGIANLTYSSSRYKVLGLLAGGRKWYNSPEVKPGCGAIRDRPPGTNCDEYPFFSTHQGGDPQLYPESISLQLVNGVQNKKQGSTLGGFYRTCLYSNIGTAFVVIPTAGETHGEEVTREGKTQCWPRSGVPLYVPITDDEEELLND